MIDRAARRLPKLPIALAAALFAQSARGGETPLCVQLAPNHFRLTAAGLERVEAVVRDPLIDRIVPAYQEGKPIGLKIFVRTEFADCGLRAGDLLLAINGHSLIGASAALTVRESIERKGRARISLRRKEAKRDDPPLELTIEAPEKK